MRMISEQNIWDAEMDISAIREELCEAHYLGRARRWPVQLYSFDGSRCPHLMRRVQHLRSQSFGAVGVVGSEMEGADEADEDGTYRQLVVWDDRAGDVVGGYRYAVGRDVVPARLSLSRYFRLSTHFVTEYLPYTLELGRSFVAPHYQRGGAAGTIYALDALWEALARVVCECDARYLVGRVTLYPSLGVRARNLLVGFLRFVFPSREMLFAAHEPFSVGISRRRFRRLFGGATPRENYKILISRMHSMHRMIPPIISSYIRLSPSMQTFDAYINHDLGEVAEMGIMLTVADIYDDVKRRYFAGGVTCG